MTPRPVPAMSCALISALICGLWPLHLFAQAVTTDAFGIVPGVMPEGSRQHWAGLRGHETGAERVAPDTAAASAILFAGPKSVVAGKEDEHVVVLALDRHGNMLDGASVRFSIAPQEPVTRVTQKGIGDVRFRPDTRAGAYLAGADLGTDLEEGADGEPQGAVQSARADYNVTADLASVAPRLVAPEAEIGAEIFSDLVTEPLADRFGNRVEDGVGPSVLLRGGDGRYTLLSAPVSDGVAQAVILTRDVAGLLQGALALGGQVSAQTPVRVAAPALDGPPGLVVWPLPSLDAVMVRVGPMATDAGYVLTDGSPVRLEVTDKTGGGITTSGWALDGFVSLMLPLSPGGAPFDVTVSTAFGGTRQTVPLTEPPEGQTIRGAE